MHLTEELNALCRNIDDLMGEVMIDPNDTHTIVQFNRSIETAFKALREAEHLLDGLKSCEPFAEALDNYLRTSKNATKVDTECTL